MTAWYLLSHAVLQLLSHLQVYTAINHTLQSVFPAIVPFLQHLPSFADCWVNIDSLVQRAAQATYKATASVPDHDVIWAVLCAIAGLEHGIHQRFAESTDSSRG